MYVVILLYIRGMAADPPVHIQGWDFYVYIAKVGTIALIALIRVVGAVSLDTRSHLESQQQEPLLAVTTELGLQCSICLDNIEEPWSTNCGHIYCKECILAAIDATHRCPLCKKNLQRQDAHRLFF